MLISNIRAGCVTDYGVLTLAVLDPLPGLCCTPARRTLTPPREDRSE
ncbi:hypothetical protein [Propionicimonas sp. T2.31MG-18]